jgi:hypothetical protein
VVLLLETDPHRGLDTQEASVRLERFGPNTLPAGPHAGLLLRVLRQFHHPLIYVLIAAGAITASLGEYVDSTVIFGVVVINAMVGFIQESKAEAALEGLRSMVRTHAKVVRGGRDRTVPSDELVPGDLVLLEGRRVLRAPRKRISCGECSPRFSRTPTSRFHCVRTTTPRRASRSTRFGRTPPRMGSHGRIRFRRFSASWSA